MGTGIQRREFTLSALDIDEFLEWMSELSTEVGVERQNNLRVSLLIEEILLRMRDRLGESVGVIATYDARFRRIRRPRLQIEVEGDAFNPLSVSHTEMGNWSSSLCTGIGLMPQYSYEWEKNVLKLSIPCPKMNLLVWIGFAIALGLGIGVWGSTVLPASIRQGLVDVILTPTYDMWIRMLNALSGPVVFLTVITTMINTRGIVQKGGSSLLVIMRYFVISIIDVTIALACSIPFFPLEHRLTFFGDKFARSLFEEMLLVVPSNIFDPFVEANTPQLLFMGFVLGYMLIRSGDRVERTRTLFREANMIGLKLAGIMGMLVPFFVESFICLEFWQGETAVFAGLWKPLVLSFVCSIAILVTIGIFLAWRMHTNPLLIAKKLWPSFSIALKTGSLDEAYGEALTCCTQYLGINRDYTREALPQGLVLYMPISAVGIIVYTIYAARVFCIEVTPLWFVITIVLVVVLFVATPPVPGANLLAYVVLFATLGIPEEALIDAMTFDILFGIFAGAANQALLQMEMVYQANRFGLLNAARFRKPIS